MSSLNNHDNVAYDGKCAFAVSTGKRMWKVALTA